MISGASSYLLLGRAQGVLPYSKLLSQSTSRSQPECQTGVGGSFKLAVGIHAMKLDWCIALCHGLSFVFGIILLGLANQLIDLMP